MATLSELTERLSEHLVGVINSRHPTANAYDHVGFAKSNTRQRLPSLNYQRQVIPVNKGMHGESYVDEVVYSGGEATKIIYRRDFTLFFDVIASVTDNDVRQRDGLYTAVEDEFTKYSMWLSPEDLHEDVSDIRVKGIEDESRPDDAVRGDRVGIEIDFSYYREYGSFEPIRDIHLAIETGDSVEEYLV